MKKIICLSFALLIAILCITSCGNVGGYTALEVGGNDYISSAKHSADIMLETKEISEFNSNRSKNVSYYGTNYIVSYNYTRKDYLYNNDVECYSAHENGISVDFDINKNTGVIDRYFWVDRNYIGSTNLIEKTQDECAEIATNYLSDYVDNVSAYNITSVQYFEIPEYGAVYSFDFVRTIGEIKTSDSANIGVTKFGDVVSHSFSSLGEMKSAVLPSDKNMLLIKEAVSKKLNDIYENIVGEYDISFAERDVIFMRLANGRYAFEYTIEASLLPVDAATKAFTERVELLIYV